MAYTVSYMNNEENRAHLRRLYDGIAANEPASAQSIEQLKEFMLGIEDPDMLPSALTEEERCTLRDAILQTVLQDLAAGADPVRRTDPLVRLNLELDYRALQALPPLSSQDSAEDLLTYATLCLAVDRCREAQDLFQALAARLPGNLFVQSALIYETSCLSIPGSA